VRVLNRPRKPQDRHKNARTRDAERELAAKRKALTGERSPTGPPPAQQKRVRV
jgi:hypothetical protein